MPATTMQLRIIMRVFFLVSVLHLFMNTRLCRAVICTTNLGLEYNVQRTSGNLLAFSINACCPCRSQPVKYQLPYCGLVDFVTKVSDIKTQADGVHRAFASSIYGGMDLCSQGRHSDIARNYDNITSTLLYSYQQLTEIALKFYIIQHHNSSRIGVNSGIADDIGETLCHLQSVLGDSEMSESVYRRRQEVTDMDIGQMVPYTCRTLTENVAGLVTIEDNTRKSLLTGLNEFA